MAMFLLGFAACFLIVLYLAIGGMFALNDWTRPGSWVVLWPFALIRERRRKQHSGREERVSSLGS